MTQPTEDQPTEDQPTDDELTRVLRGRARRAPRYAPFITTGVVVGLGAAALLVVLLPPVDQLGPGAVFAYLALVLGLVGGLAGAAVAVGLDRRSR